MEKCLEILSYACNVPGLEGMGRNIFFRKLPIQLTVHWFWFAINPNQKRVKPDFLEKMPKYVHDAVSVSSYFVY